MAPDIEARLLNQKPFKLSALYGQYVLLDFWGSWCGPCRQANKGLVKLYDKYKDKQFKEEEKFTIISVGIETNKKHIM